MNKQNRPRVRLTPKTIENLRPQGAYYEVRDVLSPLRIGVQSSGHKSFLFRYRRPGNGKAAKLTFPAGTTLADARVLAAVAAKDVAEKRDPGEAQSAARLDVARTRADTLASIAENFLKREGSKLRTFKQRENTFYRLILPDLGTRPIGEIRRADVVKLLDKIEDRNGKRMADIVLASLSRLFNWHSARDDEFRSPLVRGMGRAKPAAERERRRTLTDEEIRAVWGAAGKMGIFGNLVKFLLYTSARRSEAAEMRWSELSGSDWTLPPERHKVGKRLGALVRPLPPAAMALLADLPRISGSEFVFCAPGGGSIKDITRLKRSIDKLSGVTDWRLHDLRRCAASLMSRAGVPPDHGERVLGHLIPGQRRTYDRHDFHAQKKFALEALAAQVMRIVEPPAAVVVPLRG